MTYIYTFVQLKDTNQECEPQVQSGAAASPPTPHPPPPRLKTEIVTENIKNKYKCPIPILSGLHTVNLSWQIRVGKLKLVCVNGTKTGGN